ncbi:hypothetical protein BGZ61DRAFT_558346 [Ilyonectria robusta]|uniref:uncharacterized protein n=1 Tax=Ilyonectria robusta TaxID=1079257 RepID=UPI001E8CB2CC|nr:uncharacterized protein BGZ61DRAFT_558346 [Ilyonectria robusta]KAH8667835.1 hypothetical protein BGZ61DRAFT_558346 [Ilyonectria robusta]
MRHFWKCADGSLPRILSPVGLFVLLASLILTTNAQAIDANLIDITKYSDWNDLRACVQCWLSTCPGNVFRLFGCTTNACACRASTLGSIIPVLEDGVVSACSNLDDASTAVSVLKGYCSEKGYTSILEPTILETTACIWRRSIGLPDDLGNAYDLDIPASEAETRTLAHQVTESRASSSEVLESSTSASETSTEASAEMSAQASTAASTGQATGRAAGHGDANTTLRSTQSQSTSTTTTSSAATVHETTSGAGGGDGSGLKVGEILGIVIGILSLIVAVVGVAIMKRNQKSQPATTTDKWN